MPSATATHASSSNAQDYVMPRAFDFVRWYSQIGAPPAPGIVTAKFDRVLQVQVFFPDTRYPSQRDGVRHITDPMIGKFDHADIAGGFWDYTESDLILLKIMGDM